MSQPERDDSEYRIDKLYHPNITNYGGTSNGLVVRWELGIRFPTGVSLIITKADQRNAYVTVRSRKRMVPLQRHVAEQMLGMSLSKSDEVHHINTLTLDNRWCNLLVCTKEQHNQLHTLIGDRRWSEYESLVNQILFESKRTPSFTWDWGVGSKPDEKSLYGDPRDLVATAFKAEEGLAVQRQVK